MSQRRTRSSCASTFGRAGPVALLACVLGACGSGAPQAPPPALALVPPTAQGTCLTGDPDEIAAFPDESLGLAIRRQLGLARVEPLTCAAVRGLRHLDAPDARIGDLTGIGALESLEVLYVYGNNSITDVTPLTELRALRDLNLARNDIVDIGPLAELTSLTSLSLYGNPIEDISALAALTGLTRLQVEHTAGVADLTALGGLHALTRLELSGNRITDLSPLAGLTRLTWLSLQDNAALRDLGPLRHLTHLEILDLGGTAVTDLAPLGSLGRLDTLGLGGTRVTDLGALMGLPHLSRLDLRGSSALTDIQPLLFSPTLGRGAIVRLERTGVRCEDVASLRVKGVNVMAGC